MISGNYTTVPIDSITINRELRQRVELPDLTSLANSIARIGLLHAPVITSDGVLVSGECRLTACRDILGWTDIPVQLAEDMDESTSHLIELEENVRRTDLAWQDKCLAVANYHNLTSLEDPAWTAENTATALGMSSTEVSNRRDVALEILSGNEMVTSADKYSVARGITQRKNERAQDSEASALTGMLDNLLPNTTPEFDPTDAVDLSDLAAIQSAPVHEEPVGPDYSDVPIINADFAKWAPVYSGPKFNLIHCDFPYGIDHDKHDQSSMDAHGSYDDSFAVYVKLLDVLEANMDTIVAPSAHMIFWFSMTHYNYTLERLHAMGWTCDGFCLIWDKNNSGTLPDPNRGPRRGYEVAFFCTRGDRKIVRAKNNITCHPVDKRIHTSAKPMPMLQHFYLMLVDETTRLLDPTCGSGNSIAVLKQRFPKAYGLGLEIDPEFHALACKNYEDTKCLFD